MARTLILNGEHERSPHGGFRDPILTNRLGQYVANYASRYAWQRGGVPLGAEADSRRDVADECGWPKEPTLELYRELYLTDAVAARVVEVMPKETWFPGPLIYESEDETVKTPTEEDLLEVRRTLAGGDRNWFEPQDTGDPLVAAMLMGDVLSGVGSYGGIYCVFDDDREPDQPVEGVEVEGTRPVDSPKGKGGNGKVVVPTTDNGSLNVTGRWRLTRNAAKQRGRQCIGMLPLPEWQARVLQWESNRTSPRYGHPVLYQVWLTDQQPWFGSSPTTSTFNVHWTRMVHLADTHHQPVGGLGVSAAPRMRCVLPEILDGRKVSGADGEAFFQNAFLKIFFQTHESLGGDVLVDDDELKDMMENIRNGFQQHGRLSGMSANPVAPAVADVTPHQAAKIERICIKLAIPKRIFMGSEQGELASSQDSGNFAPRKKERQSSHNSPKVVHPTVNRLILAGCVRPPKDRLYVDWPDPANQDELTKAQVFSTRMTGFAAALGGNVTSLITEENLLIKEAGYTREEAEQNFDDRDAEQVKQEEEAQALADRHGFEPAPPEGFKPPEPPPEPPAAVKVKPGEKLVHPPPPPTGNEESVLADNAFNPDQPRDDKGMWAAGGSSIGERVKAAVAHVGSRDELWPANGDRSVERIAHHHGIADKAVAELSKLSQADVHQHLKEAGVEGVRPGDSKKALLAKLHDHLTAAVRSRERNQV